LLGTKKNIPETSDTTNNKAVNALDIRRLGLPYL